MTDKGRIEKHIKPLLGPMKVAAVTREDVEDFMHKVARGKTAGRARTGKTRGLSNVRGGTGTASRTVGLLGAIFSYAVKYRMRTDNPVWGVMRPADGKRERRLSDDEYPALGTAHPTGRRRRTSGHRRSPMARFLALTGWRSGEAQELRWEDVDLSRRAARLADTKTGFSMRPLSHAACDILRGLDRSGDLVFPATRGGGPHDGLPQDLESHRRQGRLAR